MRKLFNLAITSYLVVSESASVVMYHWMLQLLKGLDAPDEALESIQAQGGHMTSLLSTVRREYTTCSNSELLRKFTWRSVRDYELAIEAMQNMASDERISAEEREVFSLTADMLWAAREVVASGGSPIAVGRAIAQHVEEVRVLN